MNEPVAIDQAPMPMTQSMQNLPLRAVNPMDASPVEFRQALARRKDNRSALIEWIRDALVEGVDFGSVPLRRGGFSKPSLRKPGAEKICGMLGVTATFPTLRDYEAAALAGREIANIIIRCHIVSADGAVVADGIGARTVEQDGGDTNKSLKMALKSSQIDATLRMAGLSEIFTQDLEDLPPGQADVDTPSPPTAQQAEAAAAPQRPAPTQPPQRANRDRAATERQLSLIRFKLDQAGIVESEFLEKFEIPELSALPFNKVNPALHWIAGAAA